ncbi:hypothetical protein K501DRAFT_281187, partial [Backusella circina FSU 941]
PFFLTYGRERILPGDFQLPKIEDINLEDVLGSLVLLRFENKKGLEYNWMRPYRIVNRNLEYHIYQLQELEGRLYSSWVHADRLNDAHTQYNLSRSWYLPRIARSQ